MEHLKYSLVSLFNGISSHVVYLMPIHVEEQQWYYLTHSWDDEGVHTFPKVLFGFMAYQPL